MAMFRTRKEGGKFQVSSIISPSYQFNSSTAHCGAAKGQLETLKIISKHGYSVWLQNDRGDFPLHEAVQSGRKDLVRWLLLKRPDNVDVANESGRTPLHVAALNNNVEMCKVSICNIEICYNPEGEYQ